MKQPKFPILFKIFLLHLPLVGLTLLAESLIHFYGSLSILTHLAILGLTYLSGLFFLLLATSFSKKLLALLHFITKPSRDHMGVELSAVKKEYDKKKFILDNISEGICAINQLGQIVFYNQRFHKRFLKPLSIDANSPVPSIETVFKNHEDILQAFYRVLRTQTDENIRQVQHVHQDREFYFDININITEKDLHDFAVVLGVFHDVTDKRLADLMRVNFVANISHEMRTPLTSILGFAEVLQSQIEANATQDIKSYVHPIIQNAKKLQTLFSDLLNLSTIESERKIQKSPISLDEIFEQQLLLLSAVYPEKKIHVHKAIQIDHIEVDRSLFEQVITNLLDNSIKYSKHAAVNISLSSEKLADESILIQISDDNSPVPDNQLERIFERFYRLDSARNTNQGSGIGLSIVKQILSKHKGKAFAKNIAGKTYFCLSLPKNKTQP